MTKLTEKEKAVIHAKLVVEANKLLDECPMEGYIHSREKQVNWTVAAMSGGFLAGFNDAKSKFEDLADEVIDARLKARGLPPLQRSK